MKGGEGHGADRQLQTQAAHTGKTSAGAQRRGARDHPGGDAGGAGPVGAERGAQEHLRRYGAASPAWAGRAEPPGDERRLVHRGAGLRAGGAEAAGGRGAVQPVPHPAQERRPHPQAGGADQRPSGPAAPAAGIRGPPDQNHEREHFLQRGQAPGGHRRKQGGDVPLLRVQRPAGAGVPAGGCAVQAHSLRSDLGQRELLSGRMGRAAG